MSTEHEHELRCRYERAAHAMQTGVQLELTRDGAAAAAASPKHLRVGINAVMADHGALAALLIRKGLISEEDYLQALVEGMEAEVGRYHKRLGLPNNVSLG